MLSAHSDLCSLKNLRRIAGGTFYKDRTRAYEITKYMETEYYLVLVRRMLFTYHLALPRHKHLLAGSVTAHHLSARNHISPDKVNYNE